MKKNLFEISFERRGWRALWAVAMSLANLFFVWLVRDKLDDWQAIVATVLLLLTLDGLGVYVLVVEPRLPRGKKGG